LTAQKGALYTGCPRRQRETHRRASSHSGWGHRPGPPEFPKSKLL